MLKLMFKDGAHRRKEFFFDSAFLRIQLGDPHPTESIEGAVMHAAVFRWRSY